MGAALNACGAIRVPPVSRGTNFASGPRVVGKTAAVAVWSGTDHPVGTAVAAPVHGGAVIWVAGGVAPAGRRALVAAAACKLGLAVAYAAPRDSIAQPRFARTVARTGQVGTVRNAVGIPHVPRCAPVTRQPAVPFRALAAALRLR